MEGRGRAEDACKCISGFFFGVRGVRGDFFASVSYARTDGACECISGLFYCTAFLRYVVSRLRIVRRRRAPLEALLVFIFVSNLRRLIAHNRTKSRRIAQNQCLRMPDFFFGPRRVCGESPTYRTLQKRSCRGSPGFHFYVLFTPPNHT